MRRRPSWPRKLSDVIVKVLAALSALFGLVFLAWILYVVLRHGASALSWKFLTTLPSPPGVGGGGLANAIIGTAAMTLLACVMGVPVGLMAGVYLAEFGRGNRFATLVRFLVNVMMGIPSIIVGLFVYTIMVRPVGHFSGWAGAVSLALLIMPVVARTTEDMLTLVPNSLRESALALGVPHWRSTVQIMFRAAKAGLLTGVLLAVARVSGETAPLLFTALDSPYWPHSLNGPTGNLTVTIFNYAMSPYPNWQQAAWGASFLITAGVLALTIVSRALAREKK
ncbi:MAG: phosphate ABC transporter permease PstA [Acidobacteria bacterium]|jgi:phosphate transport system permease protein|nr:phosphate ABC transporter permease PstA [Acidobacteriota bacterium]